MGYFFTKQNHFHRHSSLYLFITIAFLLLGLTNTAENNTNVDQGFLEKLKALPGRLLENLTEGLHENSTTNQSSSDNETSIFHKPKNINDVKNILLVILRVLAQALMIFGGVIPYIPQYLIIKRTQNAEGFSNYVCLTLLVANIIRIEFWFGKHFEIPLLLQSIVMIICMLIMLEVWTRVHAGSMPQTLAIDDQSLSTSKEQLTEEVIVKKFTDFEVQYFWRWTKYTSYLQFLLLLTILLTIMTWVFIHNQVYIETIGFLAVFFEALLGMPQFIRNFRLGSTEGMSVKMVLLWASGDIFKTVYFIIRKAPKQFWACGILQISIDIAILFQVFFYSKRYRNYEQE